MRGILGGGLILGAFLTCGGPARAGVYLTVKLESERPLATSNFQQVNPGPAQAGPALPEVSDLHPQFLHLKGDLGELRNIPNLAQNPELAKKARASLAADYINLEHTLSRKEGNTPKERERGGTLGILDEIDLGACRIRMGKPNNAITGLERGLKRAAADDPARFLLLLNLAAAYHDLGFPDRAIPFQEEALKAWPPLWAGWSPEQYAHYRRTERFFLKFLKLRDHENRAQPGGNWQTLDALFSDVTFVGAGGEYEAGAIAPKYFDELPPDDRVLVVQMVYWLPFDDRLYWLLGELLNAHGDVLDAADAFNDLVNIRRHTNIRQLWQHRQILREAATAKKQLREKLREIPHVQTGIFWALAPRGVLMSPGLGNAANELGSHLVTVLEGMKPPVPAGGGEDPNRSTRTAIPPWLPDWRQITVSFVAGALVTILVFLQWSELRRRNRSAAPPPEDEAEEPKSQEAASSSG